MFSQAETEALVLGMRWVSRRGDSQLASAAGRALAKIADAAAGAAGGTGGQHAVDRAGSGAAGGGCDAGVDP